MKDKSKLREPTSEQCQSNEKVWEDEDNVAHAIWYPQMGGYVGRAIAVFDKQWEDNGASRRGGCIDLFIWHNGSFPFGDEGNPVRIHHCDAEQFIVFGEKLEEINNANRKEA